MINVYGVLSNSENTAGQDRTNEHPLWGVFRFSVQTGLDIVRNYAAQAVITKISSGGSSGSGSDDRGGRGSGGFVENYFNPMIQVVSGSSSIRGGTRSGGRGSGGFGKNVGLEYMPPTVSQLERYLSQFHGKRNSGFEYI